MYRKILMAYNGSQEGRTALVECADFVAMTKAETHLLAVAGMPSSMFLTEGFLPEELLDEEKNAHSRCSMRGWRRCSRKALPSPGILPLASRLRKYAASRPSCNAI